VENEGVSAARLLVISITFTSYLQVMKWTPVSRPDASLREYRLAEKVNTVATLKYNPLQQSARIRAGEKQQVFFIEKAGFRNNKLVVENEYGVRIGASITDDFQQQSGDIILYDTQYHFKLITNGAAELVIYRHEMVSPLAVCSLSFQPAQTVASMEYACLSLGLCWYLSASLPPVNSRIAVLVD
jgi:hypothetical protein